MKGLLKLVFFSVLIGSCARADEMYIPVGSAVHVVEAKGIFLGLAGKVLPVSITFGRAGPKSLILYSLINGSTSELSFKDIVPQALMKDIDSNLLRLSQGKLFVPLDKGVAIKSFAVPLSDPPYLQVTPFSCKGRICSLFVPKGEPNLTARCVVTRLSDKSDAESFAITDYSAAPTSVESMMWISDHEVLCFSPHFRNSDLFILDIKNHTVIHPSIGDPSRLKFVTILDGAPIGIEIQKAGKYAMQKIPFQ